MEGWRRMKLGEVLKLEYGKPLPPERRTDDGKFPAYGANGVKCRTDDVYWEKPSVIIGRKGSAGEVNLVDGGFWPLDVTYFIVFDDGEHDLGFLYYLLSRLNLPSMAKGVKPGLNRNDVYAVEQWIPPLPEQERIVAILDEAFAAIATAIADTEKNLKNVRALFESHLQSAFAEGGSGWPLKKLGELSEQITDGTHNSPPYVDEGIPMFDSKLVKDGFVIDDSWPEKFISAATDALLAKRCKPRAGDILISSRGSIGKIAIVGDGQDFNIMGNMILIRLPAGVSREFAAYYLHSRVTHIESIARGVAQKGLYLNQIREYEFPLAPAATQVKIGQQLRELSARTRHLEAICKDKLTAFAELKQSILHKAFTGELTADFNAADVALSKGEV